MKHSVVKQKKKKKLRKVFSGFDYDYDLWFTNFQKIVQ